MNRPPGAGSLPTTVPPSVTSELTHYLDLEPGWDGHPLTKPAKPTACEDAMGFLGVRPKGAVAPVPGLHTSGGIAFVWESPAAFASITIEGDGKWSGYGYVKDEEGRRRESFWDGLPIGGGWPQDLVRIVRKAEEKGR